MNIYRTEFFAKCPVNGIRIRYSLEIHTKSVVRVEQIIAHVERINEGFHEPIADDLFAAFGGQQTLIADHHGVAIETRRGRRANDYLDQSVGGMAGTPGY